MISLCSVMLDNIDEYKEIFINSIIEKTKLVSEVVFANNSKERDYYKTWSVGDITFKEYGSCEKEHTSPGDQHGFGLNFAIDKASNETVYLCDPDIFFYSASDEFFFKLKEKYNLQVIGGSHHSATELCQTFFPWHGNLMVNKKDLPDDEFLKDELPIKGKYLMSGHCDGEPKWKKYKEYYPNPNGNWDTSSALWLHSYRNNWKWLSFQTLDSHSYTTQYFRGNIKIQERFKKEKLFYHAVSGTITKNAFNPFKNAYDQSNDI